MPLSSETIRNKPLSGPELIEIILKGTRELLARDGMFATHVGYGRVAFRVRVELEMDNLTYPHHSAQGTSSPANTEEAAQTFPLPEPAEDSVALDLERSQQITSPNATRILNDLPVQV